MRIRTHRGRNGQALIFVTVSIMLIFGMLGLAVDIGWMHFREEAAQTAADAAAMASAQAAIFSSGAAFTCGAANISCQSNTACPNPPVSPTVTSIDVACAYANTNGFHTGSHQTVSVAAGAGTSPPTAPGLTVGYWITVRVAETNPQSFSTVLGNAMGTVSARATAGVSASGASSCIYVLDPSMKAAYAESGGASVSASCGVFVNSSNSDALDISGGATITSWTVNIVGGYKSSGGSTISPSPNTGSAAITDPFASLPNPAYSGCDHTGYSTSGGAIVTISPGVYCNGMKFSGGSTITMQPGMYVIDGGGFSVSGGSTVTGSGVTIFNTSNAYSYKPFAISGGTTVTLSAPRAGTYRGILFYNDRNITDTNSNNFSGGALMQLTGSLYFPSTAVSYTGGTNTTVTAIVAKSVTFSGGTNIAYDATGAKTGLGTINANMIE